MVAPLQWGPAFITGKGLDVLDLSHVPGLLQWGPAFIAGKGGTASRSPPRTSGYFNGARLSSTGKAAYADSNDDALLM